jgi:hypothetical protein
MSQRPSRSAIIIGRKRRGIAVFGFRAAKLPGAGG